MSTLLSQRELILSLNLRDPVKTVRKRYFLPFPLSPLPSPPPRRRRRYVQNETHPKRFLASFNALR